MFTSLFPILGKANLSFTISAKGDKISVTVVPKSIKGNEAISNSPLAISGTAEELDANFVTDVTKALGEAVGYSTNAEEFVESTKAKASTTKKDAEKKTADTTKPAAAATTDTSKEVKAPVLTANQKKLPAKAKEAVEKARNAADTDMVSFLKKQTVKMYTDAKMPDDLVKALEKEFDDLPEKVPAAGQSEIFPEHTDSPEGEGNGPAAEEEGSEGEGGQADDDTDPELVIPAPEEEDIF